LNTNPYHFTVYVPLCTYILDDPRKNYVIAIL
jgi:hypothetical protein